MLDSYRRVLGRPGALAFSVAALVGRMPISMMTLGIVLLVVAETGSYAEAGRLSAVSVLSTAAVAVPHGRLLDRRGQRPILLVTALVFAVAAGLLTQSVLQGWPSWTAYAAAALVGVGQPQIGSSVRARWAHVLPDAELRRTAFAWEGVADEVVFVTGPTLATFAATLLAPWAGVAGAVVLGSVGTVALAQMRDSEPAPRPASPIRADRIAMPWAPLLTLSGGAVALGTLFGSIEVATVAFSEERDATGLSGVLLAVLAFGSLLSGIAVGAISWRRSTVRRMRIGATALTVAVLPTPFVTSLSLMAVVLFVAGFAVSPTLIALVSRVDEVVPASRLTEGMALIQAGFAAGVAPGAALAGLVVDGAGGSAAYWVGVVAVAVAGLATLVAADD